MTLDEFNQSGMFTAGPGYTGPDQPYGTGYMTKPGTMGNSLPTPMQDNGLGYTITGDGSSAYSQGLMQQSPQQAATQQAAINRSGGGGGGPFSMAGASPQASSAGLNLSNLGFGGATMSGANPYLQQQGDAMLNQMTTNFKTNVLPSIDSAALASGNYGSSRQGVLQANALNQYNQTAANGLANLYGNNYGQALNYNLGMGNLASNYNLGMGGLQNQAQANANNYNLGMNNNALGYANLDANINQNNVQNQLQGAQFGLGLANQGTANANTAVNAGTNIQNTPMGYYNNFSNTANGLGRGYSTTSSTSTGATSPLTGMMGGAQLWNAWNNSGNRATTSNMTGAGGLGFQTPGSSSNGTIGNINYGIY